MFSSAAAVVIILALSAAVLGGFLGYSYWQFIRTPAGRWRHAVLNRHADLQADIDDLQRQLRLEKDDLRAETNRITAGAFRTYLSSISVDELQEYPGIGPVTVEKLRDEGLDNLELLRDARFDIAGIGPKRARDIRQAVSKLLAEADGRFNANACPAAQAMNKDLADMQKRAQQQILALERSLEPLVARFNRLAPYVEIAKQVSLYRHIARRPVPELTEQLLEIPVDRLMKGASDSAVHVLPPADVSPKSSKTARLPGDPANALPAPPAVPPPDDRRRPSASAPQKPPAVAQRAKAEKSAAAQPQLLELQATVNFAYGVALLDGKMSRKQRDLIRAELLAMFGHQTSVLPWIDPIIERVEKDVPRFEEARTRLKQIVDRRQLKKLYQLACKLIDVTQSGTEAGARLQMIAAAWELEPTSQASSAAVPVAADQQAIVGVSIPAASPGKNLEWLQLLEIAPGGDPGPEQIRRQYRLLFERFDPLKVVSHGAEFVELAKSKRQQIRSAAEKLLEPFGQKLEDEPATPAAPSDPRHNPDLDAIFGA